LKPLLGSANNCLGTFLFAFQLRRDSLVALIAYDLPTRNRHLLQERRFIIVSIGLHEKIRITNFMVHGKMAQHWQNALDIEGGIRNSYLHVAGNFSNFLLGVAG
jgi:hypothetical protein